MEVNLTENEVAEIVALIEQAWNDGFDSEALQSLFEKLSGVSDGH